jgi:hypothetical protein
VTSAKFIGPTTIKIQQFILVLIGLFNWINTWWCESKEGRKKVLAKGDEEQSEQIVLGSTASTICACVTTGTNCAQVISSPSTNPDESNPQCILRHIQVREHNVQPKGLSSQPGP